MLFMLLFVLIVKCFGLVFACFVLFWVLFVRLVGLLIIVATSINST